MIKNSVILKIYLKNFLNNYNFFHKINKKIIVGATIKANAYGLGVKKIFQILVNNDCKHFFVATIEEGIEISSHKKKVNIYILNGIQNYDLNLFKKFNLIPIINTERELKLINKTNQKFGIHVDTGINRLGINYKNIPSKIFNNNNIKIVISHLSSADEKNNKFNEIQKKKIFKN